MSGLVYELSGVMGGLVLYYTEETNLFCVSAVSRTEGGELLCDYNVAVYEGIGF